MRSLAKHPLFQVMLTLQNTPEPRLPLPGMAVSVEPFAPAAAKFDLTLGLSEQVGAGGELLGIGGVLEYSLDLFERETAEGIAARYVRLLEAAIETPDQPLHKLEILDAEERQQLLESFNATARAVPEATLPELFEEQVARTPDAVAVVFGGKSLS